MTFVNDPSPKVRNPTNANDATNCRVISYGIPKYPYKPIQLSSNAQELRLVVLYPGAPEEDLFGEIIHVELSESPRYEALSYTWADESGDKEPSMKLNVRGGRSVAITANCHAALRRLRRRRARRTLWIDAVCIDQSNVKERNHQVNHLKSIFNAAFQVVIYLGESSDGSDRFLEYISMDVPGRLPDTRIVADFFARRWFHRVWILQEIAAARAATIYCGQLVIRWEAFTLLKDFFTELGTAHSRMILPSSFRFAPFKNPSFLDLLHSTRHCAASDPRDKIFALVNLATDAKDLQVSADYSKTTQQVFVGFASRLIMSRQSLHILSFITGESTLGRMPSWVPDWSALSPSPIIEGRARYPLLKLVGYWKIRSYH